MRCPNTNSERLHCDQLLNAAEDLVDENGLVSFRFAEMAKLASCSNHVLYKHFKSKEDVLVCLFLRNCTSNFMPVFLEKNKDIEPRLLAAFAAVFSFVAVQRSPTFNTLRSVSINSLCWQLASDDKVNAFRQRVNLFWHRNYYHIEQAQQQQILLEPADKVLEVTQSIYFFLAGILSSFESGLMDEKYLGKHDETFFNLLCGQLNKYKWIQRFTASELRQLADKINLFFDKYYQQNKSCKFCQRLNGLQQCDKISAEIALG
ncbi:TetR/AcrR family transcriptional regulator [Ferrimonas lipolytica]|uniref:TetR/AcrR family transcriptional regulator n=1 Tax=Ferrimonas lipolytica TaxID=2724191 RepID=A0A6H1UFR3_9GAMM|nr:TetR/AcrR family transcriptional regulator [Ferrimonas lipolytica]QIZ77945.1 TetR/AcrR family transcriptional regulator [Ferrimonas lipolytica]